MVSLNGVLPLKTTLVCIGDNKLPYHYAISYMMHIRKSNYYIPIAIFLSDAKPDN